RSNPVSPIAARSSTREDPTLSTTIPSQTEPPPAWTAAVRRATAWWVTAAVFAVVWIGGIGDVEAQSIGIGGGFGFPFTTYVEDELDREFRVVPEPGYYPVLRERTNENFGLHINVSLVLEGR